MKWSNYQQDIFDDVRNGAGHVLIEAVAGSGKTSSLIESLNNLPSGKSWLMVAFNKKIAEELRRRAPSFGGECRTLHSLGLRSLYKSFPNLKIDQDKTFKFLEKTLGKKKFWDEKGQLSKTISLCKGYLIEGAEFIDYIMDHHDIETFSIERQEFIAIVQSALDDAKKNVNQIDFDDMIYLPFVHKTPIQKYHFVFADECQDLNNAQIQLVLRTCKRNGRIFAVGDQKQAIYSWRGASINAMEKIAEKLNAKRLPLSITYRCPILVTKEAQQLVPHIEHAPDAPDGTVQTISSSALLKTAKPGCFILSRTNAPLIGIAIDFIKRGVPASIQGRDIGANLLNLIKKSKRKTLEAFLSWLISWEKKEIERLRKKDRPTDSIEDRAACLRAIADSVSDLVGLKEKINTLFEDTEDKDRIVLSTVHRAKGLERENVFMLMNTFRGGNQEEKNIRYVAITRSKKNLYKVTG